MPTKKLTAAFVKSAAASGRTEYFDTWQPRPGVSFVLRVGARSKAFQLIYRIRGKPKRYTLGYFPDMGLADAHDEAQRVAGLLLAGDDPAKQRERTKAAPLFGDFADRYMREYAKVYKRRWQRDQEIIDRDLREAWADRNVLTIDKADCRALMAQLAERGPVAHNRTLALVRRMFNWAAEEDIVDHNPTLGIKMLPERSRDRVYSDREIAALWHAYGDLPRLSADCLRCIVALAQRPNEVMSMRAQDIEGRWWTIPRHIAKNGLAHRVYLPDLAYEIVARRLEEADEWIFPSPRHKSNGGPIDTLQKAHEKARGEAGVSGQIRDWRRTGASRMASAGVPRYIVGRVLNHVESGVTRVYDRHSYDAEKRQAMETWNAELSALVTVQPVEHFGT